LPAIMPGAYCARATSPRRTDRERLDGVEQFHLLVADRLRVERARRLHRGEREELHRVVLDHVAQAAALLVVAAARAHADLLRHGDLHAVDEVAVPQRLEDGVGEPLHEQVLHRLLPEVVIDPVHLVLLKDGADRGVEFPRRRRGPCRTVSR
jgi:hypothetical protein